MNFASDNVYGIDGRILAAIGEANETLTASSYATDELTIAAETRLSEVFERDVQSFLVVSGTAANGLCLSTMAQPYNAILCYADAHIMVDECGSPELMTGGAKLYGIADDCGKVSLTGLTKMIDSFVRGEHNSKPSALSLTQATELGTVYTLDELKSLTSLAHDRGLKVHMDGARFANALVSLGCSPAEMSWKLGIDALSFGATKNGAMALEAIIFFDNQLAEDFEYRRMRAGQLLSKSRYLGAQMLAYLKDDLWLDNARHANAMSSKLRDALSTLPDVRIPLGADANLVFPIMPQAMFDHLRDNGVACNIWPGMGPGIDQPGDGEAFVRMVTSFNTREDDISAMMDVARRF